MAIINYLSYGLEKVLVLKLTQNDFDANKINFSVNLIDDLIIENTSDVIYEQLSHMVLKLILE